MSSVSFSVREIIDPSMAEGLVIGETGAHIVIWIYKRTEIIKNVLFFFLFRPHPHTQ